MTYTASENIITESCANWWCGHSATATLAEPSSLAYDGSSKAASVSYGTDWKGDTPTVEYLDSSGAAVDADSVVNAGTYAQYKGYDVSVGENTNILSFDDATEASEYAIPALQWAVGSGLIEGTGTATLSPQGSATRAQAAAILTRFIENIMNAG
ncbi:MAG: S-layer homology domain-containing protein [Oscillospiraceae bacterium]|nr:S-layer homology domain-containing protein [Oscillospiraceae bacterium]